MAAELPAEVQRAQRARKSGRNEEARRLYAKYLQENPEDTDQRTALASVYLALGQTADAERELEKVFTKVPDSVDALLVRGNLNLRRERFSDATADFESVLRTAPDYCDALVGLARAALQKGDPAAARAALERVGPECRDYPDVKQVRAQLDRGGAEEEEETPAPRKSTAATPGEVAPALPRFNGEAVLKWARERLKCNAPEEAEMVVRQLLVHTPQDTDALVLLGQILLKLKRAEEAVTVYTTVTTLAPDYCDAWHGLSDAYVRLKDFSSAQHTLASAPAKCLNEPDGLAAQGRFEQGWGEYQRARELFLAALCARPCDPDLEEAVRGVRLFRNSTNLETEQFERTGTYSNLSNVLTYRPRRWEAYDLINERISRDGMVTTRHGLGATWTTCDGDKTLRLEGRQSLEESVVPSRYSAEGSWRILNCPGTELLASFTRFNGYDQDIGADSRADVIAAGFRQRLSDRLIAEVLRQETFQREPASARAGVTTARLTYEEEGCRTLSLGLATGDEVFAFDRGGSGAGGSAYSIRSVSASWREWIGEDWGIQVGAGRTTRGNGNDSRSAALGVFFEF